MAPDRAALKTLVQCRPLWIWHVWGLCVCLPPLILPLARPAFREGALVAMLIVPLWSGIMAASVCKDFLSKPFSFGVPHHQTIWRRTLFSVGFVAAGVCSLAVLLIQIGTPGVLAVTVWQAFLWCLAVYLAAALLATAVSNTSFLPGVTSVLLLILLDSGFGAHIRVTVGGALLASPVVTIATCVLVALAAWRVLGSRATARRLSGEAFLPIHSMWSGSKQTEFITERKLRRMRKTPGALMMSMERFFLARMRALSDHPTAGSLLGTLYILAGKAAPARASNLFVAIIGLMVLAVALGFYHPKRFPEHVSAANLVMFLICAIKAEYRFNPYAALLLNISRKNRFRNLMFAALVQTVIVTIFAAAVTLVSIAIGSYLDQVTLLGRTWTYDPIVPKTFFLFMPMLPFLFFCQILFPKNTVIPIAIVGIVAVIVFAANVQQLLAMGPFAIALLQVVCWLPFMAFTRHYCFFWDLKLDGQ